MSSTTSMRPATGLLNIAANPAEAVFRGLFRQIRFLLDSGACPDAQHNGNSALRLLALVHQTPWAISLAQNILEHGGKVEIVDKSGRNALHEACLHGRVELLEVFLKAADFDLNTLDVKGNTSLHLACLANKSRAVQVLVDTLLHYNSTIDPLDRYQRTPLMVALKNGKWDCAKILQLNGASLDVYDSFGRNGHVYLKVANDKQDWLDEGKRLKGGNLRFDDVKGWSRQQERLRSAPQRDLLTTAKRNIPFMLDNKHTHRPKSSFKDKKIEISIAPDYDVRNDPVKMFHETPEDHFKREKIESRHQPRSYYDIQILPPRSGSTTSWRNLIRPLYNHMEFQYSESYRLPAKAPLIQVQTLSHMDSSGDIGDKTQRLTRRGSNVSYRGGSHREGKKNVGSNRGKGTQKSLKPSRSGKN